MLCRKLSLIPNKRATKTAFFANGYHNLFLSKLVFAETNRSSSLRNISKSKNMSECWDVFLLRCTDTEHSDCSRRVESQRMQYWLIKPVSPMWRRYTLLQQHCDVVWAYVMSISSCAVTTTICCTIRTTCATEIWTINVDSNSVYGTQRWRNGTSQVCIIEQ